MKRLDLIGAVAIMFFVFVFFFRLYSTVQSHWDEECSAMQYRTISSWGMSVEKEMEDGWISIREYREIESRVDDWRLQVARDELKRRVDQ